MSRHQENKQYPQWLSSFSERAQAEGRIDYHRDKDDLRFIKHGCHRELPQELMDEPLLNGIADYISTGKTMAHTGKDFTCYRLTENVDGRGDIALAYDLKVLKEDAEER
jgi:hypothetical protein